MTTYTFTAIAIGDMTIVGPDPFSSGASRDGDAIAQNTQITLASSEAWTEIALVDDDPDLEDADGGQALAQPLTFNGTSWGAGQSVEIEYSYVIRPVGSTDPGDQITIYVLEFGSSAQGIAADGRLAPGVTYEIIPGGSDDPVQSYANLTVCFATGTPILTARGWCPVEAVRPGDLVETLDHGVQPVVWAGGQEVAGTGRRAPVRIARGVLGNTAPLHLSPQHRVLLSRGTLGLTEDQLVPVKALIGIAPGVRAAPCLRVGYHHLLLEGHRMIRAAGAPVESMLPGPMALKALTQDAREQIFAVFPELQGGGYWTPVRPLLKPGQARRFWRGQGRSDGVVRDRWLGQGACRRIIQ